MHLLKIMVLKLLIFKKKYITDNKMNEYASTGTYYFKTAKLMLNCFNYVIQNDLNVNSEFYVSIAYKKLLLDKRMFHISNSTILCNGGL